MARRKKDRVRLDGVPGLALGEEALYALRHGPISMHVAYLLGTVPFMLGLLFFWFDMSQNAQASLSVVPAAIGMTVLFVWMKVWHAVFSILMRDYLSGREPRPWTVKRVWGIFHRQSFAHAVGLILMPLALLIMLPFPIVHAFFYTLSAVDDEEDDSEDSGSMWSRAWRQALLWKGQNTKVLWLFSPWLLGTILGVATFMGFLFRGEDVFLDAMTGTDVVTWIGFAFWLVCLTPVSPLGILLGVNVGVGIGIGASLVTSFFGVQTVLGMSGPWAYLDTGFLVTVFCICYLVMDPIMRAVYVLRVYYGDSIVSGEAIRTDLLMYRRRMKRAAMGLGVIGLLWLGAPTPVMAERVGQAIESQTLDAAIDETLQQRKYQWRGPGEKVFETPVEEPDPTVVDGEAEEMSRLDRIRAWVKDLFERFEAWLNRKSGTQPAAGGPMNTSWWDGISIGGWSLIVVAVAAVIVALYIIVVNNRKARPGVGLEAAAVAPVAALVDVSDESVTADALPSDEWMKMGNDYLAKGEVRLALRAYTLAMLAALAYVSVVRLARHKSNGDYRYEVQRGLRDRPELIDSFSQNMRQLERTWYGDHGVDQSALALYQENLNRVMTYVRTRTAS